MTGRLDFFFYVVVIVCEFIAERTADFERLGMILHYLDVSEHNDAFDSQRPVALLVKARVVDAERRLVAAAQRVESEYTRLDLILAFFAAWLETWTYPPFSYTIACKKRDFKRSTQT